MLHRWKVEELKPLRLITYFSNHLLHLSGMIQRSTNRNLCEQNVALFSIAGAVSEWPATEVHQVRFGMQQERGPDDLILSGGM